MKIPKPVKKRKKNMKTIFHPAINLENIRRALSNKIIFNYSWYGNGVCVCMLCELCVVCWITNIYHWLKYRLDNLHYKSSQIVCTRYTQTVLQWEWAAAYSHLQYWTVFDEQTELHSNWHSIAFSMIKVCVVLVE